MDIDIEERKERLIGRKVTVINEYKTVFREVTDIIDEKTALKNPEIRSGARDNLLYVVEGLVESTSEEYVRSTLRSLKSRGAKVQIYIYPDTKVLPIEENSPKQVAEETVNVAGLIRERHN